MEKPPYATRMLAELIGTFGFLFIAFSGVAVSVLQPEAISSFGVAAAFGLGLAFMIFSFGQISGGHFNPAVTLGLVLGGQFPYREVLGYWAAQVLGAIAAVGTAIAIYSDEIETALVNTPGPGVANGEAFVLEAIATALFLIVISAVATDTRAPWSGVFAPAAIGGFLFIALAVIGPFSGGSLNPARSLAPALLANEFSELWIYLAAPLVGGVIGGLVFLFVRSNRVGGGSA